MNDIFLYLFLFTYIVSCALRPNILFILTDDMGIGEVGVYDAKSPHGRIPTPNIDSLAATGMIMSDGYSGVSVCAPSRCSLLTGRHTGHTTIRGNLPYKGSDYPLNENDTTFVQLLSEAGYTTGLFGKWGQGNYDTDGAPWKKGFDYYYGILDQSECHNMYPTKIWDNDTLQEIPENKNANRVNCMAPNTTCRFAHDLFVGKLMEWLHNVTMDTKPFFAFLSLTDPHAGGWFGVEEPGNPVPTDGIFTNESWPDVEKDHASVIHHYEDKNVGVLVDMMNKLNIRNDTLIIFTSDNGAHAEGGHNPSFFSSNGIFKGIKRSLYEGGIRTPLIFSWPGKIKQNTTSKLPTAFWDFMPTFCDLAGINPPNNTDGVSILPTLLNIDGQVEHDYLYWEFCTNIKWGHAIRLKNWKGVSFSVDQPIELYDLIIDPSETNNIADKHPDIVDRMKGILAEAHTDSTAFPVTNCVSS